jgi:hypothetical protein
MFVVYSNNDKVFVMKKEDEQKVVNQMIDSWSYDMDKFEREEVRDDSVMISFDVGLSIK